MPFLLAVIGAALVISAVRGTQGTLGTQLASDVPAFLPWAAAIVITGMLGYIPKFQKPANLLLALVLVVIFLRQGSGFVSKFGQAFAAAPAQPAANTGVPDTSGSLPVTLTIAGGSGNSGLLGGVISAVTGGGSSGGITSAATLATTAGL